MPQQPLNYFTDSQEQPPFLKTLAAVRRIGMHEGSAHNGDRAQNFG